MSKIFEVSIEEVVKWRYSVRTFKNQEVTKQVKDKVKSYIDSLSGPFSPKVTFKLLESDKADNAQKLGTYGFIKGASNYIGATVKDGEFALEELGYEFEKLILFAASLGLGTCWLGGTFNKSEFAKAMEVQDNELFPAISPLGVPADRKRLKESLIRLVATSNHRKEWNEIFFNGDFSTPLQKAEAVEYAFALEMVRLAPSASNKQPWRIVKDGNNYHLFEFKTKGYGESNGYDIQRIDIGIAACHFHLAAIEKNLNGEFKRLSPAINNAPDNARYVISWVCL